MTAGKAISALIGGLLVAIFGGAFLNIYLPYDLAADRLIIGAILMPVIWSIAGIMFCTVKSTLKAWGYAGLIILITGSANAYAIMGGAGA
ncbi:hypothetical protein [Kordiimonas laminariae]|uniref:hypothetical protein n=1 Tax=Kordiimonas laminariae TaxID=2917717 RepID=UPI001FF16D36|nr:hypothetical protein [Kordiimonas laminariae]MCK0067861.1 hypothetical protein [Kordiimonas laminariae]